MQGPVNQCVSWRVVLGVGDKPQTIDPQPKALLARPLRDPAPFALILSVHVHLQHLSSSATRYSSLS